MIVVSACLLGENCKYSGGNNRCEKVLEYLKDKEYIAICPEQLGGLSTPRDPSEIITAGSKDGFAVIDDLTKVVSNKGLDVTANFVNGAKEALKIAKENKATSAILKDGSPSCGYTYIYDGSFSKRKIKGKGVTAALLEKENVDIINIEEI